MAGRVSGAIAKYEARALAAGSLLCIGLDPAIERVPSRFLSDPHPQFAFNRWLIEQTHPFASAYKLNTAFYEARGTAGWDDLDRTMAYLRQHHPDVLTIGDAKRADIGNTNDAYAAALFDHLGFDAITLHPYLGGKALAPFLKRADKGCIILCRTSNSGAGELQDLSVNGAPLWHVVAAHVRDQWNAAGNCMLVIGATHPAEVRQARALCPHLTLLVPGVGAQGGDAAEVARAGADARGLGLIVTAGRSIIFADDPATEARTLRDAMRAALAR